jgi:hypothetical protein
MINNNLYELPFRYASQVLYDVGTYLTLFGVNVNPSFFLLFMFVIFLQNFREIPESNFVQKSFSSISQGRRAALLKM